MTYRAIIIALVTAAVTAALIGLLASKADARSAACLDDASYQRSAQRIPADAGRFRSELSGQVWRFYAKQAYGTLHPQNSEALPTVPLPVACSASFTPVASALAQAYAHEKAYLTILSGFPSTSDATKVPTRSQWKAAYTQAALTDQYAAAVLTALHSPRAAAIIADRAAIIAMAKAVR